MLEDYGVGIIGVGHYLPERIQTNEELCQVMTDISPEWIISKTGIKRRYIAGENESASSMATTAVRKMLEINTIAAAEIGLIVVATFSPELK
jgi:3-oxoacyl-[acyl-carrier-protein] synthase-3